MPLLSFENISIGYDNHPIVENLSFDIEKGDYLTILGENGAGKSTLLKTMLGLIKPLSGKIVFDKKVKRTDIGYLPQQTVVQRDFPASVWEIVISGCLGKSGFRPFYTKEEKALAEANIKKLGLEDLKKRCYRELSGGQRQRVALARSLAKRPKLLLLDEPMGALDKKLRAKMQLELVDIIERVGVTCVMVTHDQEEAMTMAGRVAIMDKGEFIQIGDPEEIYENPNCVFTAEFIGSVNLFEGVLGDNDASHTVINSDELLHPIYINSGTNIADGMKVTVALRPEKIWIETKEPEDKHMYNYAEGIVENIAYMGDISIYHVRINSGKIVTVTIPNMDRFRTNQPSWEDKVYLHWEPDSSVVLII